MASQMPCDAQRSAVWLPGSGHRPHRAAHLVITVNSSQLTDHQHIVHLSTIACPGSQRAPCLALPSRPPLARGMTNPTALSTSSSCSHSTTARRTSTRRNNGSTPPFARQSTHARPSGGEANQTSSSPTPASSPPTTTPSTTRASARQRPQTPLGQPASQTSNRCVSAAHEQHSGRETVLTADLGAGTPQGKGAQGGAPQGRRSAHVAPAAAETAAREAGVSCSSPV